jgi:hypothetical protein
MKSLIKGYGREKRLGTAGLSNDKACFSLFNIEFLLLVLLYRFA